MRIDRKTIHLSIALPAIGTRKFRECKVIYCTYSTSADLHLMSLITPTTNSLHSQEYMNIQCKTP